MPEPSAQQALERAMQLHLAGRLADAEATYRRLLAHDPRHADALHLLGVIADQVGRHDDAVKMIRSAITVRADVAEYHGNLGLALNALGHTAEAIASYRRAIELQPTNDAALNNLGVALAAQNNFTEAIAAYQRAIHLQPGYADALSNLALSLRALGRLDEAIAACREAIRIQPDNAGAFNSLGIALTDQRKFAEAIAALHQSLRLQPNHAEPHINLGAALMHHGEPLEAITAYRRAIQLRPGSPEAHSSLGVALSHLGRLDEAETEYARALQLRPDYAEAHNNLGNLLGKKVRLAEAIASYRRALQIRPDHAEAHNNLGNALKDFGRIHEAIASYREALRCQPHDAATHSNLIFCLHYAPEISAEEITAEQQRWNALHAAPFAHERTPHLNIRSAERRLRIGYVSADFRDHVVGRTLLPCFEAHDREAFDLVCYSGTTASDAVGERFRNRATQWRETSTLSDENLAALIREDRIDILVDLALHTAGNRLRAFARKPAPVQISWLGYPGSSGLDAMDWRITDPFLEPPSENAALGGEQPLHLPECWCCYAPPHDSPAPGDLPALENGHVTFASFNNSAKISERVLALWARILRSVKGSRLLLLSKEHEQPRTLETMQRNGVSADRIAFLGFYAKDVNAAHAPLEYLRRYQRADIALDPFPYNGMTTTCDALWMGVPVVALTGTSSLSRASFSLLSNAGLGDLAADSEENYAQLATALALDLPRLSALRADMRVLLGKSPLLDAARFTRNLEHAYRTAWRRWCAT